MNAVMLQSLTNIQRKINHGRTQKIKRRVGVVQGGIPTRGPIVQEGFLEIGHRPHNSLLMSHLTLKNPLKVQSLHLIEIRGRGLSRIAHMKKLRSLKLLVLMEK